MLKRFKRSDLNKFLGHEAVSSDVVHSHAYGKVAKESRALPRPRYTPPSKKQKIPGYRDSMVGSIAQYRDRMPVAPSTPSSEGGAPAGGTVIGNRPQSGASGASSSPAGAQHRFVEPPKRNFR